MAFAVRAHNHLWGKNNEDPLIFLFRHDLGHDFSKQMYLGWNKFGQDRPYDRWGIKKKGKFKIPPGIVFPHIIEKDLKALFIIPMEMQEVENQFSFPGNPDQPVILGNPDNEIKVSEGILKGLNMFQDNPDNVCIKILI